jgi:hypothetical protein
MLLIKQSESTAARRRVPVVFVDDTDGKTAETGVTLSAGDMKLSKDGGAEGNHAGSLTELAGGDYYYEFTSGEVDTLGYLTGRIVKNGVRTFRIAAQVVAFDPYATSVAQTGDSYAIVNSGTHGNAALKTLIDAIDDFVDTEMAAVLAAVDTEVAAIKAKTDSLTFTVANVLDANLQRVNDVALVGDGSATPWGP